MKRIIIAALLTAACAPVPPSVGRDLDVVITTNQTTYKYRINTTRPTQQVEKAVAFCAESVHTNGIESVSQCLRNQGFSPIYILQ